MGGMDRRLGHFTNAVCINVFCCTLHCAWASRTQSTYIYPRMAYRSCADLASDRHARFRVEDLEALHPCTLPLQAQNRSSRNESPARDYAFTARYGACIQRPLGILRRNAIH